MCDKEYSGMFSLSAALDESTRGYKKLDQMHKNKILWIDIQPSLYCLFKRTAQALSQQYGVKRWSFEHDPDESCDIEIIHGLLKQTVENSPEGVNLVGHGLSGTIAYLYAKKYPKNVCSVSLLSVDVKSCNQWTSHYQTMRNQLPCSRYHILGHLSKLLVETHAEHVQVIISRLLAKCLDNDFVNGSIIKNAEMENLNKINVPILVVNGGQDFVIDHLSQKRWQQNFKPGDCYQTIDSGRHFFPFSHWQQTAKMIESFIDMVPNEDSFLREDTYQNLNVIKHNS